MNDIVPNIHFFPTKTPLSLASFVRFKKVDESESRIIQKLIELGYTPYVDTERECTRVDASGFYLSDGFNHLQLFNKGDTFIGRVFMLVYFNGDSSTAVIETYRELFSEMLELQYSSNRPRTRKMAKLFSKEDLVPNKPQLKRTGSELYHNYKTPDGRTVTVIKGGEHEDSVEENIRKAAEVLSGWEREGWGKEIKVPS